MEFKQVVGNRRTIRFFDPNRPVEEEKIQVMLEAANRASRAVNADFAKAIVCYRDELTDEVRQQMKTPTTTVQIDLAPVTIFWYGDTSFVNGAQVRLKELVDLGALPVTHGWTHAYVDDLVYPQVLEPCPRTRSPPPGRYRWKRDWPSPRPCLPASTRASASACTRSTPQGVKDVLKVPDHWVPMWILLVGYPAEDAKGGGQRPRRSLSDSFYRGQYGNPWSEIPDVTERLKREGMIQEPMPADPTQRMSEIRKLAERFGLPQ